MGAGARRLVSTFLGLVFFALNSDVNAQVSTCGPDCSTMGRYVLCNDSFTAGVTPAGGVELSGFLDAVCSTFPAPAASFTVSGFIGAFGSGQELISLVEIFEDSGATAPDAPAVYDQGALIPAAASAGLSGLEFTGPTLTQSFRLCVRQQLEGEVDTRPLLFDTDGAQGVNTTFIPNQGWASASARGVNDDFILRAAVHHDDLTPWMAGGVCQTNGSDAGVSDGSSPADAGVANDGGPNVGDASIGPIDGGSGEAPTINAITPREVSDGSGVDVTVTGTNFRSGLSLTIGMIATDDVMLPGPSTILAHLPDNGLAPGVYDVVVRNSDGQTAILSQSFTIKSTSGAEGESCGCTSARSHSERSAWWPALLVLAMFSAVFRRR